MIQCPLDRHPGTLEGDQVSSSLGNRGLTTRGKESMTKAIILSICLAASSFSVNARAQDVRQYTEGPVTEVDYLSLIHI